jgi:hypothetical protein
MLQSLCSTGPPSRVPASRCARPTPGRRAKTHGSHKDRNIVSKPASYPSTNYDFNKPLMGVLYRTAQSALLRYLPAWNERDRVRRPVQCEWLLAPCAACTQRIAEHIRKA